MHFTLNSQSPEDTIQFGQRLGRQLKNREIILISGELGVGKTLFVKGIAAALGIPPACVVSPTFVLMNLYHGSNKLFHFDLYRLGAKGKIIESGIDEYIGEGIIAVEWAQFLQKGFFSDEPILEVNITFNSANKRTVDIQTRLDYIKS